MNSINHGNSAGNTLMLSVRAWRAVLFLLHVQCRLTALLDYICEATFAIQKHWGALAEHTWKIIY